MDSEMLFLLGMYAGGAVLGMLTRWGPLSKWVALIFAILLPPVSLGLTWKFC
jgi:hypothetical protein